MKLIPAQYQELEAVCNEIDNSKARCICFISLTGNEGSTSLCASVAQRLSLQAAKVLIIDLNPLNPFKFDEPKTPESWCFSDISCQLNIINTEQVDLLTMAHLKELESVKNKSVLNDAIERIKQEYDYIFLDMSPALKCNRGNVPLHALSLCTELTFLTVSLGYNDEEALCHGMANLEHAGVNNVKIVVAQHQFAPLGTRIVKTLKAFQPKWPKLTEYLLNKVIKQRWLFLPY
ncbi:AAA family ATPase [Pseudoalteromonas elyakovii]|nr:AAA family ATPase [Pseudoalteromonas elyakovii]